MPDLTTDRLEIRPVLVDAAAALATNRALAAQVLEASLPSEWPRPGFVDVMRERAAASTGQDHFGIWVIVDPTIAAVIGDVGFHGPPTEDGSVEIGYSVLPDFRDQGFATEAATALVRWASSRPQVRAVIASCDSGNSASIRTLEKAGFRRTGESDGEIRWRYAAPTS